ncbi:hypothetical protein [Sphaerisporangium krabiense]|uniref:4-hydroxybenzoate polyprenyltransferase n=1 Tax=Sphaerisporangium krabiense TaxID=763782 RepID=A0A7W9DNX5_9ACTN|nr:hypothetical protein [Sphaerisporangium krabiense]MBB5624700.1 4-hydroxybenzoate polyprenyltransferase [Sphaerisporangium krabiense]
MAGSFPPKAYVPYAVAWAIGAPAACALTDARLSGWVPDVGSLVGAVSLLVVLLMMRALDDIRDLGYDREHNPGRPLAAGAVSVRDLTVMIMVGTPLVLALNAWRPPVMGVLAAQLAYAYLVIWADRRLGWPRGDALLAGMLVNLPVQLLINGFLYAGLLHSTGLAPSWRGALGILVTTLAFLHLEFARKTTRRPRPGERTYVTLFGPSGTAALAVACAIASVAVLVTAVLLGDGRVSWAVWLSVAPLAFACAGALRFWIRGDVRWPYGQAASFLLATFAGYQIINLIQKVTPS